MIDIDYSIYAEGFSEYTGTVMVVEESQVEIVHLSPSNLQYSEESANYVLLYPNPTNGILHIKAAKEMPVKLRIFDMTGSRIFDEFVYDGSVIRMDHYGKGIYHFEMQIRDEIIHETVIRK